MSEQVKDPTTPQGIQFNYKLIKGGDNHTYVSLEPLMDDIQKSIDKMMDINIDVLSNDNKQLFDLKLLGLKTVYEFLGALKTEQTLREKAQEFKGTVDLKAETFH
jgi:hypothetical protein